MAIESAAAFLLIVTVSFGARDARCVVATGERHSFVSRAVAHEAGPWRLPPERDLSFFERAIGAERRVYPHAAGRHLAWRDAEVSVVGPDFFVAGADCVLGMNLLRAVPGGVVLDWDAQELRPAAPE
ncbi:MAG TPA: hypothetical protein VD948_08695 [Rhodothermales bacterium]|nr:hypothetical protein [Rhodothermales bacterium]